MDGLAKGLSIKLQKYLDAEMLGEIQHVYIQRISVETNAAPPPVSTMIIVHS